MLKFQCVSNKTVWGIAMIKTNTKNIIEILKSTFLFSSIKDEDLLKIVTDFTNEKSYKKNSIIFSKNSEEKCIAIIVKGTAQVKKEHIVLNTLKQGDMFGAITLYNNSKYFVNDIVAISDCRVIFINKDGIDFLISKSPRFAKKYIEYLSDRIYFLNGKIDTYTSPTADDKLYAYLVSISNDNIANLNIKMTELAKQLNLSRASLYRAFDELIEKGKISKDKKKITIK